MGGEQIGAKQAARGSQQQNRQHKKGLYKYSKTNAYYDFINQAMPGMQKLYEPTRVQESDQAALGEQQGLQGMDVAAGRTGMLGSGAHLGARADVRANRQAMASQALVNSYMKALGMVTGQAGNTISTMQSFMSGQPMLQQPTVDPYSGVRQAGGNALALWLANGRSNQQAVPGVNRYNYNSFIGPDYRPLY